MLTQDQKKTMAAKEALKFLPKNEYIGIGTGSTVNVFIEALAPFKDEIKGVVTTSKQSHQLLAQHGFNILSLNEVDTLAAYFDGADEVNAMLQMIKGGGGALLAEKVVASNSNRFICMVDDSKVVKTLGTFPVAVEVLPYACSAVSKKIIALGGKPELRIDYVTESGNQIIDVHGLTLFKPLEMEFELNKISGVIENGIFAHYPADVLVIGRELEVEVQHVGAF